MHFRGLLLWFVVLLLVVMAFPGGSSGDKDLGVKDSSLDDFPDSDTLTGWISDHTQQFESGGGMEAWYEAALTIQRQAAADGYLVSAVIVEKPGVDNMYLVWCTALADGALYWWHPEDSEPSLLFTADELTP